MRALGALSPNEFLSAANDATIHMWSIQSAVIIKSFHGHEAYIYR